MIGNHNSKREHAPLAQNSDDDSRALASSFLQGRFCPKVKVCFQRSVCSQVTVGKNKAMKEIPGGNADPTVILREAHCPGTGTTWWESSRTQLPKIPIPCLASEKTTDRAGLSPTPAAPTKHSTRDRGVNYIPPKSINAPNQLPPNQLTPKPINPQTY